MLRAFLSHSSSDKERYVRIVAQRLGSELAIFDERTFEEGMPTYEEIHKHLAHTDLFVLFISDAALRSRWVQHELEVAYRLLREGDLQRLYPIIIDPAVTHSDPRIPDWMRREFNLKFVGRPTVAARRIEQQMRRLSWVRHPAIEARERIFVGRNDLIRAFEERMDSFDQPTVRCFIASGLRGVGRRALIRHCLAKASLIDEFYDPPSIVMGEQDSLEDFILRLYDLGFSEGVATTDLLRAPVTAKIDLARRLLLDCVSAREIVFVLDHGSLVGNNRDLVPWFRETLRGLASIDRPVMSIAARYRPLARHLNRDEGLFALDVPELSRTERRGLLKRYSDLLHLDLPQEELHFLGGLLTGFPEQVFYAADFVASDGLQRAHSESFRIAEYSAERISAVLNTLEGDAALVSLITLLAEFDFVADATIHAIMEDEDATRDRLEKLLGLAICERLGATGEYLRLNDAVRDYAQRYFVLPEPFVTRMRKHLAATLAAYEEDDVDAAEALSAVKAALLSGADVDERFLIPSHFLRTIKELYDQRRNTNRLVIDLADRALENAEFMERRVEGQIRFYLCSALARLHDVRFIREIERIPDLERSNREFLFGFYYRHAAQLVRAVEAFNAALKERPRFPRAMNELARIYLQLDAFDLALPLAKVAYDAAPNNTYFVRTYFEALVRTYPQQASSELGILRDLLAGLRRLHVRLGDEFSLNAEAQYAAFVENDLPNAMRILEEVIGIADDPVYHLFTLFEIALHFRNVREAQRALASLRERGVSESSGAGVRFLRAKAQLDALSGDLPSALRIVRSHLSGRQPDEVAKRFEAELERIASVSN